MNGRRNWREVLEVMDSLDTVSGLNSWVLGDVDGGSVCSGELVQPWPPCTQSNTLLLILHDLLQWSNTGGRSVETITAYNGQTVVEWEHQWLQCWAGLCSIHQSIRVSPRININSSTLSDSETRTSILVKYSGQSQAWKQEQWFKSLLVINQRLRRQFWFCVLWKKLFLIYFDRHGWLLANSILTKFVTEIRKQYCFGNCGSESDAETVGKTGIEKENLLVLHFPEALQHWTDAVE